MRTTTQRTTAPSLQSAAGRTPQSGGHSPLSRAPRVVAQRAELGAAFGRARLAPPGLPSVNRPVQRKILDASKEALTIPALHAELDRRGLRLTPEQLARLEGFATDDVTRTIDDAISEVTPGGGSLEPPAAAAAVADFGGFLRERGEHHVLVYGVENARESYRQSLPDLPTGFREKSLGQPVGVATTGYYTADRYSNYSWRDFTYDGKAEFSIFQPAYVEWLTRELGGNRSAIEARIRADLKAWTASVVDERDRAAVLEFQQQLLDHPSWSPLVTFFESGAHSAAKEGLRASTATEVAKAKFQSQTRRASKFGLLFMKTRGGAVAFLREVGSTFGELPADSSFTVNKGTSVNRPGGGAGTARVPITVSEERAAHRERRDFPGLVHFGGGRQVAPPWVADRENWGVHSVNRAHKYNVLAYQLGVDVTGKSLPEIKSVVEAALRRKYPTLSLSEARAVERSRRARL